MLLLMVGNGIRWCPLLKIFGHLLPKNHGGMKLKMQPSDLLNEISSINTFLKLTG